MTQKAFERDAPRRLTIIQPPSWRDLYNIMKFRKLLDYRDLILTMSIHRIKVRYKQSLLGVSWALLQPFAMMLIFTFVFSSIARMPSDGAPYAIFTYAALLPWTFFATSLANSTNSLVNHTELVTKVYFPREILPLTYVFAALVDFAVASTLLVALLIYFDINPAATAVYAIPIVLIMIVFALAMALLFSATQVRFRDIGVAVPLLLQVWMFATPVVYPLSSVPQRFQSLYVLNPMVGIVENFRRVIVFKQTPDLKLLSLSATISFALLVLSYFYFKRREANMADFV